MICRRCTLCGYACPTERTSGVCPTCTQHLLTRPVTLARRLARFTVQEARQVFASPASLAMLLRCFCSHCESGAHGTRPSLHHPRPDRV